MLRLHPTGYAQHERASTTARPERSGAKSKGEQRVFTTHLKKDPYRCRCFSILVGYLHIDTSRHLPVDAGSY